MEEGCGGEGLEAGRKVPGPLLKQPAHPLCPCTAPLCVLTVSSAPLLSLHPTAPLQQLSGTWLACSGCLLRNSNLGPDRLTGRCRYTYSPEPSATTKTLGSITSHITFSARVWNSGTGSTWEGGAGGPQGWGGGRMGVGLGRGSGWVMALSLKGKRQPNI